MAFRALLDFVIAFATCGLHDNFESNERLFWELISTKISFTAWDNLSEKFLTQNLMYLINLAT